MPMEVEQFSSELVKHDLKNVHWETWAGYRESDNTRDRSFHFQEMISL